MGNTTDNTSGDTTEKVLLMCEIDQPEAIAFLEKCEAEGLSFSDKIEQLIKNFLPAGDNHPLRATA